MCHDYKAPGRDDYAWETTVAEQRREERAREGRGHARKSSSRCDGARRHARGSAPLLPSIQVNIRAGKFPPAAANGVRYLVIPVKFKSPDAASVYAPGAAV